MSFVAKCPNCTTELDVGPDVAAGQSVECPVCLTRFVPDRPPAPAAAAPPDRPARRRVRRDDEDDDLDRPSRPRGRGYARDKVSGPATGLMVIGWIGIVLGGLGLAMGVLMTVILVAAPPPAGAAAPQPGDLTPQEEAMISGGINVLTGVMSVVVGAVILHGARKMKRLEGHGWAMTAAILSMLPFFSPCCILGLIFGIQAIKALGDEDVKAAFAARPYDEE